jgi:peroxiredoxin
MRLKQLFLPIVIIALFSNMALAKELKVGKKAPAFTLTDVDGKEHNLKDYLGKYVVLEWINYDCPFVKKHYNSGNMQSLQKKYTAKDVVWLAINSSAPGKQGNFENAEIKRRSAEHGAAFTAYLKDDDGRVGKWYGAKTTPHMFIIDPKGKIAYMGGIDDIKSTKVEDVAGATNYVASALDAALAGNKIAMTSTKPYGCGVKY